MELLKNLEGLSADEQMSAVVELQKAAMKHLEEQKQASIGKSAEMVILGLKKIKSDFEAKFDSLNYDIQTKVASLKDGEQGLQGPKGDQGERGLDGSNGRDGRDGKDGKDGLDGVDGVGVRDAKIDFDGSLVISLTDGREINCGEVVSVDVAKQIQKVTHNIQTGAGGDSQTVLDAIAALQATIATYGTMAEQDANNVAITGGTINNTTIGATTPSTGVFTTLTATGQTDLGGPVSTPVFRVNASTPIQFLDVFGGTTGTTTLRSWSTNGSSSGLNLQTRGGLGFNFATNGGSATQFNVAHTASAVNYVQVTGAATGNFAAISTQGSDASVGLNVISKGALGTTFATNGSSSNIQFRVLHAASAVNRVDAVGSATGISPVVSVSGTDTNISQVFQSKGTGAIDLAAGSKGVNISNGGTVTAITRTASGSGYTSFPSIAISAPTTAGGVQATASVTSMSAVGTAVVVNGGTGYTNGDVLTPVGGTGGTLTRITVNGVSGGVITSAVVSANDPYSVLPANPVSVTGGTGSGATFNLNYAVVGVTITNAGSGYVEQPTVTFSGGGSSGAAAYATVGAGTTVKTIGSSLSFSTPSSEVFRIVDANPSAQNYLSLESSGAGSVFRTTGASANPTFGFVNKGTGSFYFSTSNSVSNLQFNIAHTASSVNYVQVTGAATAAYAQISAQGSDTNPGILYTTKGTGEHRFSTAASITAIQFRVRHINGPANYCAVIGAPTGSAPEFQTLGTDTNIDLTLTPKGTGNVRFGTYTGTALSIAGYIEIKDSGGTVRKLAVVA